MRALFLMLVACGHEVAPPDAAARQLDIDVTVGHGGVKVFANGTDVKCNGLPFKFPQVGQRVDWVYGDCRGTCMTEAVVWVGGRATPGDPRIDPIHIEVDVTSAPDALLELTGCGGIAWIPIGGLHAPTPIQMAAAETGDGTIAVSWSADSRARTALLTFWQWEEAELVHVVDTSYTFTPTYGRVDLYRWVSVQPFDTMTFLETTFGIVKIWPGDESTPMLVAPSTPN
jgi:hypothetical protein